MLSWYPRVSATWPFGSISKSHLGASKLGLAPSSKGTRWFPERLALLVRSCHGSITSSMLHVHNRSKGSEEPRGPFRRTSGQRSAGLHPRWAQLLAAGRCWRWRHGSLLSGKATRRICTTAPLRLKAHCPGSRRRITGRRFHSQNTALSTASVAPCCLITSRLLKATSGGPSRACARPRIHFQVVLRRYHPLLRADGSDAHGARRYPVTPTVPASSACSRISLPCH